MDMGQAFIRNMELQFQGWVKNYTTAHLKPREHTNVWCEDNA